MKVPVKVQARMLQSGNLYIRKSPAIRGTMWKTNFGDWLEKTLGRNNQMRG